MSIQLIGKKIFCMKINKKHQIKRACVYFSTVWFMNRYIIIKHRGSNARRSYAETKHMHSNGKNRIIYPIQTICYSHITLSLWTSLNLNHSPYALVHRRRAGTPVWSGGGCRRATTKRSLMAGAFNFARLCEKGQRSMIPTSLTLLTL